MGKKKLWRRTNELQALIFQTASRLCSDLAVEAKHRREIFGITELSRTLSKCCRAYRVKGYAMPTNNIGPAIRGIGRTGAGVVPSFMAREWERAGINIGPVMLDWRADRRYIQTLADAHDHDPVDDRPEEVKPAEPVDDDSEAVKINNREHDMISEAGEAGPKKVPESYTLTTPQMQQLCALRNTICGFQILIDAKDDEELVNAEILAIRKANLAWLETNIKVLPHHPVTKAGLNIALTMFSCFETRDQRSRPNEEWYRFKKHVDITRRACLEAIRND